MAFIPLHSVKAVLGTRLHVTTNVVKGLVLQSRQEYVRAPLSMLTWTSVEA